MLFDYRERLPRPVRLFLGVVIIVTILYFARQIFNGYYGALAQATNGVE